MSRKSSPAPAPRDAAGYRVTPVVMNTDAMAPTALKFPGGFVSNVHADNADLMDQAAKELVFNIEARAPRNADPQRFVGIYLTDQTQDARKLLHRFFDLLLARSNAKEHRIHEMAKSKKRHRTQRA